MKKIYFVRVLLFFGSVSFAQNVVFSDVKFKNRLLTSSTANQVAKDLAGNFFKIDANSDGEIQLTEASQVSYIDVKCNSCAASQKATSIGGINDFVNLIIFNLSFHNVGNIEISGLSQLEEIDASNNPTVQVNVIGATNLKILKLYNGNLTALDATAFPNLEELSCHANPNLASINVAGLSSLKSLLCGASSISQLNLSGLSALEELYANNMQLSALDLSQVPNLKELLCEENNITALDLSNQTNLVSLQCQDNGLTELDFSGLSNLEYVYCINNALTSLNLTGATSLKRLNASNNQLTTLNLSDVPLIEEVFCTNNQISSLDLSGMTMVKKLACNGNLLTSIDVSDCSLLSLFYVSDNPLLQSVFMKNGKQEFDVEFEDVPNLQYVCADSFEVQFLGNFVPSTSHVNTYCSFIPGGTTYTMQGESRYDGDADGCSAGDIHYPNLKFNIAAGAVQSTIISNQTGEYEIVVQAGTHTLAPVFENPAYFSVSVPSVNVTFPSDASPAINDFCITANGSHPDLEISIIPTSVARPGFDANYRLVYKNKGTITQSGNVAFAYDEALVDFVSSIPEGTQASGSLSWNFTDLMPFESREIAFSLNINSPTETPAVNADDILDFTAAVSSSLTDEAPLDNTANLNQQVVNSFDPNDKTCLEGNIVGPEMIGEYVHYLIRFENTGTFPAQNIVVKDMIDHSKLDVSTLIPLHGSHPFETRISQGNKVEFIFENIQLPFDDAANDGYVAFKIKTLPTLQVGDTFSNNASIYFDYNFPIVTNTASTTIQLLNTSDFDFGSYFTIAPNPVGDILNIQINGGITPKLAYVTDMLGRNVASLIGFQPNIDIAALRAGTYFIRIITDKGQATGKFLKQ